MKELKDLLPMFAYEDATSNPGEKFSYCNAGYILLGLVIEKISGMSYFDYVAKNIFEKVGMKDTGFVPLKEGKLLSDDMTKLILEPKVVEDIDDDFTWQYGYAMWFISKDDKLVRLAFTGEDPGFSSRLFYYPEQDVEVILLSNQSDAVSNLGWFIHDLIVE